MSKIEEIRKAFWEGDSKGINLEWDTDIAPLANKGAKFMSMTGSTMQEIIDQFPKLDAARELVFQIVSGTNYKLTMDDVSLVSERIKTTPDTCDILWGCGNNGAQPENLRLNLLYL